MQAGVEYEGEATPQHGDADRIAIRAFNLLANGMGGLNWAGLDTVVAYLGITDLDDLICRLEVIRTHKPPESPQAAKD